MTSCDVNPVVIFSSNISSFTLQHDPKYIGYLSSEQALADFADYLTYLKESTKGLANSPVIAFGGSYGGMLAAWFRTKYPHICDGWELKVFARFPYYFVSEILAVQSLCAPSSIRSAWILKYAIFYFRAIAASAPVAQFTAPCDAFGRIVTADYSQQVFHDFYSWSS